MVNIDEAISHATETKAFELGANALERVPTVIGELGLGDRIVLVADENTLEAAGRKLEGILQNAGLTIVETILYPGTPVLHAEYGHIERLRERLAKIDALPIAVGSGTINDLVKRASGELERSYVSVGTAASMDGYTSAGAAIVKDGFKQTLACSAPIATFGDLDILCAAPQMMTSAGYGDLFAKIVAGADWILADEIGVEPIDSVAWPMVQDGLRESLSQPDSCREGRPDSVSLLYKGLALTGFAMQAIHKSRPASGAEHQLSHIWEMENLEMDGKPVSHGLKVAIGSLASCALFELVLDYDIGSIDVEQRVARWPSWDEREAEISQLAGGAPYESQMKSESRLKLVSSNELESRIRLLRERWDTIAQRVRSQLYPYREAREMLSRAGCLVRPEDIGVTRERAVRTILLAQMMRNRYTVLDLCYELGILEELAGRIGSSEVYWR